MNIIGMHHIALYTKDMEKSLDFYTQGLGGEIVFTFPMGDSGKTIYLVDLGENTVIEIIPKGYGQGEENARWDHIALSTSDTRADYETAIAAGATSKLAPEDKMLGSMAVCNAFVFGPDQETIEFFQVKSTQN